MRSFLLPKGMFANCILVKRQRTAALQTLRDLDICQEKDVCNTMPERGAGINPGEL